MGWPVGAPAVAVGFGALLTGSCLGGVGGVVCAPASLVVCEWVSHVKWKTLGAAPVRWPQCWLPEPKSMKLLLGS